MKIDKVQTIRKFVLGFAILIGIAMFTVTSSAHPAGEAVHETIEWIGAVAIIVCILGRTWASLYIGGWKIEQFITNGPYSVMRNPLYLFSIVGAAGVGAQLGSVVSAIIFALIAWIVFYVVVRQEERVLLARYGADFEAYRARVPRFFPNPRLWQDTPTITVMPSKMVRTFADATIFLLAIPLGEAIEHLQDVGVLPILMYLA